ncbi:MULTISPECIES: TetR/AcrR family transcriptional regulator [Niastella]|uniref:TetR/AcrR family transcriptional regulator n=1 Tax=Niastella soli TaxID=2821487 RepID=A0ABS3Z326_9BACT|nr:TetR family transcriptional regulator [Niastella soli]MBO9203801.1 TetR/AcrR family transcriptional regulator [Niastella soli]
MKSIVSHSIFDTPVKAGDPIIMKNALSYFIKKGVKNTSMQEVALKSGMSRKKLYSFCENKGKLVMTMFEHIVFKSEQFLSACPDISQDAAAEMNNLFSYIKRTVDILPPSLCREIKKYYPDAWQLVHEFREKKLEPFIMQNFERGIAENLYQSKFNKDVTCWLYFWHLQIAVEDCSLNNERRYLLIDNINNCFLQGILKN